MSQNHQDISLTGWDGRNLKINTRDICGFYYYGSCASLMLRSGWQSHSLRVTITFFRITSTLGNTHPPTGATNTHTPSLLPPTTHRRAAMTADSTKLSYSGACNFLIAMPGCCTGTYSVTPADQMSTLKPEKVSRPLAISGGWNAGDPWLVLHVSSSAKGCNACSRRDPLVSNFQGRQIVTVRKVSPGEKRGKLCY